MQLIEALCQRAAIASYMAVFMTVVILTPVALYFYTSPLAFAFLVLEVTGLFYPLGRKDNPLALRYNTFAINAFQKWSNYSVIYDGAKESTFERDQTYVMGYEPHSPLPFGLPVFLGEHAPLKDPNLGDSRILATSLVNWVPGIRHLFYWLGGVPANRQNMHSLLNQGISVCLVPGGVAECGFLEPGKDVVFLKARYGFVRVALIHGAPLVPMFCFGQSEAYRFLLLGPPLIPGKLYGKLIRKLLFCPMLIYGQWGSPLPYRSRMTLVIGKPIKVPKISNPSHQDIQKYLQAFIEQLGGMYERHKAAAGYPQSSLKVL